MAIVRFIMRTLARIILYRSGPDNHIFYNSCSYCALAPKVWYLEDIPHPRSQAHTLALHIAAHARARIARLHGRDKEGGLRNTARGGEEDNEGHLGSVNEATGNYHPIYFNECPPLQARVNKIILPKYEK